MQLTKNQVEAVRYQLKKLETTASNEDMRLASENFEQFDAVGIADLIVKNRVHNITTVAKEISEINHNQLKSLPTVDIPKIVTYQQKTEMVTSQAAVLGVTLSESDVEVIAKNIDSQATETDELFSEIRGAISAYIQFQKQASQAKIQTLLADINHEQSQANQEISEALSTGLNQFARELEVSRQSFKSSVRASLKMLTLPQQ